MEDLNKKCVTTRIDKDFHKFVNTVMVSEDEFPFKNLKMFLELGGYLLYKEWIEIKREGSEVKMAHFATKLKSAIKEMVQKGLLEKNYKGWK